MADGRFVYLTRMGDALRLGGFLVSPAEIEAVVQEAPGIAACQVVARAARRRAWSRSRSCCCSRARAWTKRRSSRTWARDSPATRCPLRVIAIDAFPVTPGANATKIQKGKLREMAEALLH